MDHTQDPKDLIIENQQAEINQLQEEIKALKGEPQTREATQSNAQQRYYDKNKTHIRAQQNEYKRKIRQKQTVKE